jgi:hypothetical protein
VVLSKDKKGVGMFGETNDDNKKEKEGTGQKISYELIGVLFLLVQP